MPICKECNGNGYTDCEDICLNCSGIGTVEWWETREYKTTGEVPKEEVKSDKGFAQLGFAGGLIIGIGVYIATQNYTIAVTVGVIVAFLAATILRLFFKYLLAILVIGYVLYIFFG